MNAKIKAIITGATGMVGEGVLHECLQHKDVDSVLVIGRKHCGISHSKLKEIVNKDLFGLTEIENQLKGYDACFFCLGTSSVGMKEAEYYKITYTLTLNFAETLSKLNPDMTFCYISGYGTDSTEKGRIMWAKVKGKTENDLMKLPFRKVFNFRPGFMQPTKGLKNTLGFYKYISWLYPLMRRIMPKFFSTLKELALAMIHSATIGYDKQILEVKDIIELSK
ncbi:MAG TPA: NAD-dependent epimerase/dehydratase family protein [Ignavibacteria bacterium]